jgi:hypothetical protein
MSVAVLVSQAFSMIPDHSDSDSCSPDASGFINRMVVYQPVVYHSGFYLRAAVDSLNADRDSASDCDCDSDDSDGDADGDGDGDTVVVKK